MTVLNPHDSNKGIALFLIKSICLGFSPLTLLLNITSAKMIKSMLIPNSCAKIMVAVESFPPDQHTIFKRSYTITA